MLLIAAAFIAGLICSKWIHIDFDSRFVSWLFELGDQAKTHLPKVLRWLERTQTKAQAPALADESVSPPISLEPKSLVPVKNGKA